MPKQRQAGGSAPDAFGVLVIDAGCELVALYDALTEGGTRAEAKRGSDYSVPLREVRRYLRIPPAFVWILLFIQK